jgi:hypothetical protein
VGRGVAADLFFYSCSVRLGLLPVVSSDVSDLDLQIWILGVLAVASLLLWSELVAVGTLA